MYQLHCTITTFNKHKIEAELSSYNPLSISITENELIGLFENKIELKLSVDHKWQTLKTEHWQSNETIVSHGLSINCPNTVFGNTKHPTTQLCIEMIKELNGTDHQLKHKKITDLGCGSGILSLICWTLGARNITGIDIDPIAVNCARSNAQLNKISDIQFYTQNAMNWTAEKKQDLIIANIPGQFLDTLLPKLPKLLAPNGALIISGPNQDNVKSIREDLISLNTNIKEYTQDGWFGWLILT